MDLAAADAPRRGKIFIISGPSGVGKGTLCKGLMENDPQRFFSISATTRPAGPGEVHGHDYHFISHITFARWFEIGNFLEHAVVHDYLYGTPRLPIDASLAEGKDVIIDVNGEGMKAIREAMPNEDITTIFLTPHADPEQAQAILRKRLTQRGRDDAETIERRMKRATDVIAEAQTLGYDHVLDTSGPKEDVLAQVESIIARAHKHTPQNKITGSRERAPLPPSPDRSRQGRNG